MQRIAIFVDAGYLLARGADAITGSDGAGRHTVILDEAKAIEAIIEFALAQSGCRDGLLRVYWYDGAPERPSAVQIRLSELDNVKLRLGTINSFGKQKGVDSLIIADMIELARNGAAADMLLIGGDEDLRIGVQLAQSYGSRVHLLGIDIDSNLAQSAGLAREADTNTGWTADNLSRFLSARPSAVAAKAIPAEARPVAPAPAIKPPAAIGTEAGAETLAAAVKAYRQTLLQADLNDIKIVWQADRSIPQPYDGRLLASCGASLERQLTVEERREMRRAFITSLENSNWTE